MVAIGHHCFNLNINLSLIIKPNPIEGLAFLIRLPNIYRLINCFINYPKPNPKNIPEKKLPIKDQ